jgi:hypothetical protein
VRNRAFTIFYMLILSAAVVGTHGCTNYQQVLSISLPRVDDLKARVASIYQAEQKKNWQEFYNITSQRFREKVSYEEFTKGFVGEYSETLISYKICDVNPETNLGVGACRGHRGVKVKMEVWMESSDGKKELSHQTDYWQYIDDVWFWTWRGSPTD